MKKLIAGLFAALLTTAGLVAVSSSTTPANAACTAYVCNATTTSAKATKTIKAGKKAKVKVAVKTRGNVKSAGTVTVTVTGPGGFSKTITKTVTGKSLNLSLGKLKKPGKYTVQVTFAGSEGFRDSTATSTIKVKPKKK